MKKKKAITVAAKKPLDNSKLVFHLKPVREETAVSILHHWLSECGRYRLTRRAGLFDAEHNRFVPMVFVRKSMELPKAWSFVSTNAHGDGSSYKNVQDAVDQLLMCHRNRTKLAKVACNDFELVQAVRRQGLADLPQEKLEKSLSEATPTSDTSNVRTANKKNENPTTPENAMKTAAAKKPTELKINKAKLVALFVTLGAATATKWDDARLRAKTIALAEMDMDDFKLNDDQQQFIDSILAGLKKELPIVLLDGKKDPLLNEDDEPEEKPAKAAKKKAPVEDDEDEDEDTDDSDEQEDEEEDEEEEEEEEEAPAPKKKAKKAPEPEEDEDEEESDEDDSDDDEETDEDEDSEEDSDDDSEEDNEDEDEPVTKKKTAATEKTKPEKEAKEKKAKPAKEKKGPGVIQTIVDILGAASEQKPVSKEKILEKLVAKIPDRDADSMKKTVTAQVGYHLPNKGYKIGKGDKGYWLKSAPKAK